MKAFVLVLGIVFSIYNVGYSQKCDPMLWQADFDFTVEDFCIWRSDHNRSKSFAQFNIQYSRPALAGMTKNFNKAVENVYVRSSSWIDTSIHDLEYELWFQKIKFDLAEVFCRRFRKRLLADRKILAYDLQHADVIQEEIMAAYNMKRMAFERDYSNRPIDEIQPKWNTWVETELANLSEFRFNNVRKIKLK
ncbi:MAG: hypothetical protein GYB31_06455 [Bacteroidetes bacterium]|nr:hypothetical protein [Bacteroidota bacterium]